MAAGRGAGRGRGRALACAQRRERLPPPPASAPSTATYVCSAPRRATLIRAPVTRRCARGAGGHRPATGLRRCLEYGLFWCVHIRSVGASSHQVGVNSEGGDNCGSGERELSLDLVVDLVLTCSVFSAKALIFFTFKKCRRRRLCFNTSFR
jgi:hypothetical protein